MPELPAMPGLRKIRESQQPRMSRAKLAQITGVSASTITQLEKGGIKEPGYTITKKLANALHVDPDAFFLHHSSDSSLNDISGLVTAAVLPQFQFQFISIPNSAAPAKRQ
jgi:transcriptional regulator with XRE-family HTH domain